MIYKLVILFILQFLLIGCEGKQHKIKVEIALESDLRVVDAEDTSNFEIDFTADKKVQSIVKVRDCNVSSKRIVVDHFLQDNLYNDSFHHYTVSMSFSALKERELITKESNNDLCFSMIYHKPKNCDISRCSDSYIVSSNTLRIKGHDIDNLMSQVIFEEDTLDINSFNQNKNDLGFIGSGTTLKGHEIVNNFTIYEGENIDREIDAFMEYNFLEEGNLTCCYHSKNSGKVELFSDAGFSYGVSDDGKELFIKNADIYAVNPLETISIYSLDEKQESGCYSATHGYFQRQSNRYLEINTVQKELCGQESSLIYIWCLDKVTICPN
jgi:hypothetical protein